ncbi:GNAT family N-acetyltransferase [Streptomyces sp. NPDC006992]|uniref:GNAT family N-acetyltransferase n=1 Tax=Streptomyces sp. NPDC006992 TaxID=3155601 RepID=UPI0033E4C54F
MQRCFLADYPDCRAELATVTEVPERALTLDYLIGEPGLTGRGLGPELIRSALARAWTDHPDATCAVIPVHAANRPSWRALEKAGLHRVAEGELTPDNPADDRRHVIYRIDRPAAGPAGPA